MNEIVFGIDLGTTNSSIAFAKDQGIDKPVHVKSIAIKQMVESGAIRPKEVLPSILFYDGRNIVGEYARSKRKSSPMNVIQSVKLKMGKDEKWYIEGKTVDPIIVSSEYLKTLKKAASDLMQKDITSAIIAVPASFDNDMRKATLDAAHLAGFNVYGDDGKPLEGILIDEPRAVLYDLLNRQMNGDFPEDIIEPGKTTRVLVFDFGGGTLDVSLHDVQIDENNMLNIDDLAISRFTNLGGDTFDQLVAEWIREEFFRQHPELSWDNLKPFEQQAFMVQATVAAEQLKLDLSSAAHFVGWGQETEPRATLSTGNLYGAYSLTRQVSLKEYEKIVEGLLGDIFSLNDYLTINQFTEPEERKNIIYPILEVLYKAQEKFGDEPSIDRVILSGGMTYLSLIKDRIKNLLGVDPIQIPNPETAVSRGAAIYGIYKNRGIQITPILAETISLGLDNGDACELVEAGTVLPHVREIDQNFIIPKNNSSIYLPLYRGSSQRTENLELIKGFYFDLGKTYPQGTSVGVKIAIDRNKIITLSAWLREDANVQFEGELSYESTIRQKDVAKKETKQETEEESKGPAHPQIYEKEVDISALLNKYFSILSSNSEKGLGAIEDRIARASNGFLAIDKLWQKYNAGQSNYASVKRLPMFMAKIYKKHPNAPLQQQFVDKLQKIITKNYLSMSSLKQNELYGAIWAIGELELENLAQPLEHLLRKHSDLTKFDISIISLGKVGYTASQAEFAYELLKRGVSTRRIGMSISALWALGKIGSQNRPAPVPRSVFDKMLSDILKITEIHLKGRTINFNLVRNAAYALGEIGDSRENQVWSQSTRSFVLNQLENMKKTIFNLSLDRTLDDKKKEQFSFLYEFFDTVTKMIKGEKITEDEERILLAIRSGLDVAN